MRIAKAYAVVFGTMHIAAMFLGLQVGGISWWISDGLMALFAFLCFAGIWFDDENWRYFLTFGWSVATMVEWMHLIAWSPPASDLQYVVFALLNMGMALSVATLIE